METTVYQSNISIFHKSLDLLISSILNNNIKYKPLAVTVPLNDFLNQIFLFLSLISSFTKRKVWLSSGYLKLHFLYLDSYTMRE